MPIRTAAEYAKAIALIDELLDEVGADEAHRLAEVLDLSAALPDGPAREESAFSAS
jgi:antitoxin component HigA of HigAB toxin-antitoxin module